MNSLALTDADLVLFERRVVLGDQHGGGDAITAVVVLSRRGKDEEGGEHRETETGGKGGNDRGREDEDKVMACLRGLDNSPAGCDAIIADPDLRGSRGRSGPRRRRRKNNSQSVRMLFQRGAMIQKSIFRNKLCDQFIQFIFIILLKVCYDRFIRGSRSTFVPKLKNFPQS